MKQKATVLNLGSILAALVLVLLVAVPVFAAKPTVNDQTLPIAEGSPSGTTTTPNKIAAFDPEGNHNNGLLEYDIQGGDGNGVFEVGLNSGIVTLAPGNTLDYETKSSYTLDIKVQDTENLTDTAVITINITDVPDETPVMNDQSFNVAENSANGTLVGKIAFTDKDVNDSHTFTINSGNTNGAFQIANNSGNITVGNSAQLNFEATTQFVLNVTIKDAGNFEDTADITINVTGVNEMPNVSDQQFNNLSEAAANGTIVGTVVATDPDVGTTLSFARTSGSTAFAINASSGQVTVADNTQLNFETNPAPTFVVTVSDGGGQSDTATITVNLTDVNDPPKVTGSGIPDVIVNVGATSATRNLRLYFEDEEDADELLTFSVQANDNLSLFSSTPVPNNGTGILTLNFANGAAGVANITIRAFDTDGAFVDDSFKVDFNEAPVAVGYANVTVQEDAGNSQFNLYAGFTDAEQPSSELIYEVLSNTNPGIFTSVMPSLPNLILDYAPDANGQANITIRATDVGGLSAQTTFNVKVNAVNDKPTTSGIPNVTVQEDADDTVIELFKYFDDKEDDPKQLTYEIKSNTNPGLFDGLSINNGQATLTLNYKGNTSGTATLVVRATDKGIPGQPGTEEFVESTFTVTIGDVNDKPVLTSFEKSTTEDIPFSFSLNDFVSKFSDADGDSLASVRIQSLPANGTLKLSGVNVTLNQVIAAGQLGNLTFSPALNWDEGSTSFAWNASDGKDYADTPANVTITVQAANDAPVVINIEKSGPEGVNINFAKLDFSIAFSDVDGQALQMVKIVSVPQHGTLKRGNINVGQNEQINVDLLDQLRYVPDQFFNGQDSFSWTGSDGALYASPAQVILTITPENDPPTLDLNGAGNGVDFNSTFAAGGPPVAITSQNLTITDVDSETMESATVIIVGLKNGSAEKLSASESGTAIKVSYSISGSNGLLQLEGPASIADFEKVLKTVKYQIDPTVTNPDTSTRNVQFIVYDGEANSNDAFARVSVINPRIKITVTPDIQAVAKGGTAVFTVSIENTGNVNLNNISVSSTEVPGCDRQFSSLAAGASLPSYACIVSEVEDRIDNKVIVTATDTIVGSTVSADDTAVVRVLREMVVGVAPVASVGDVLVKGQDAKFTITVINPSEVDLTTVEVKAYVDYDLAAILASPEENVPAPTCDKVVGDLKAGKEFKYDCTIANVQASFQIEVVASGLIEGLTPTGDFDIDQISVLDLSLDVSASPFEIPTGTPTLVEYSLTLTNVSNVPLTLNALSSNLHGNLLNPANNILTDNNCPSLALDIPDGEVRTCSYKISINAQPPAVTNIITATAVDSGDRQLTVQDSAIVSVGDFSAMEVSLTAAPTSLIAPGGTVNLTVRVRNNTASEITLDELTEAKEGNLDGLGTCEVPSEIPGNSEYSCVYSVSISGKLPGQVETRTVSASADSLQATDSVDIPITSTSQMSVMLPTISSQALAGEPNNGACSALQLRTNLDYHYFAEDTDDWYRFTLDNASNIRVKLNNYLVTEGQLLVFSGNCTSPTRIGHNGDRGVVPVREIILNGLEEGETYYIWVLANAGLNSTSPYRLQVQSSTP